MMYKLNIVASNKKTGKVKSTITTIDLDREEYYMMLRSTGRTAETYERILRDRQKSFDDLSGVYINLIGDLIVWARGYQDNCKITWQFINPTPRETEKAVKEKQESKTKRKSKSPEWEIQQYGDRKIIIASNDFTHDVWLDMSGDFATYESRLAYAQKLVDKLNKYY